MLHYQKLLRKEFDYNANITKNSRITIGNRTIISKIVSQTKLGHLNWSVPASITNASKKIKLLFLRGFFDGDGTASSSVRLFSSNFEGITQMSFLLNDLEFNHTIQGPVMKLNRKPSFIIQISRKDQLRFIQEVKPISKKPKNWRGFVKEKVL